MNSPGIGIDHKGEEIAVTSPYDPHFVVRARALGGKWDAARKAWVFDESAEEPVRQALRDCYGTDGSEGDEGAEAVTLYLYAPSMVYADRAPVSVGGITLARAFGRDSGARLGDGVAHLAGDKPRSGGSVKNWDTRIPAGCLLAVYNAPRALAERALLDSRFVSRLGDAAEPAAAVFASLAGIQA